MPTWALVLCFSLPIVVAFVYRFASGYWWWRDFDAVLCGGMQAVRGLPIYAPAPSCPGLTPSDFVYPPQIAWLAAAGLKAFGPGALRFGFFLVQAAACAFLAWLMLARRLEHLSVRARLPALGLIGGGVIACGNVAIGCHALVALSLLGFRRTRLPFIAMVALISVIKPIYAIYLVVLLLDQASWRERIARGALGALAIAAVGAAIWLTGGEQTLAWLAALHRDLRPQNLGGGLMNIFASLGLPTQGLAAAVAFLLLAGLLTVAGLAIVEARKGAFAADERWLFALGLAQLINPRPMGYDLLVLAPAIALIPLAAADISPGWARLARRWLTGICIAATVAGSVFLGGHAAKLTPTLLALSVLSVGLTLAWRRLRPPSRAAVPAPTGQLLDQARAEPVLSMVICTLDEHESIGGVIDSTSRALAGLPHEIIVVDDSEGELTARAVLERAAVWPDVRLIRRVGQRGLAAACIAGWDAARGRVLGVMDGDGQHDPESLRALLRLAADGADVALASRYVTERCDTGLTGFRDWISRLGTLGTRLLLGVRVTDPLSGLFMMRRSWFEHVRPRLSGVGFKILVDVIASGARPPRTAETPTRLRERAGGASKLDVRVMADLAGLLVEKLTHGLVSARLALFVAVGFVGVGVHMTTLGAGRLAHLPFWAAQGVAIVVAMTSNFALNNALTFRAARLTGRAAVLGLGMFYASCLAGAVLNEALANAARTAGAPWVGAALAGLVAGAGLNYLLATRLTWRTGQAKPVNQSKIEMDRMGRLDVGKGLSA